MADSHPRLTLVEEEPHIYDDERTDEIIDYEINNGRRPVLVDAVITHEPCGTFVEGFATRQITNVDIVAVRSARTIHDRDGQDITRFLKEIEAIDQLEDYISELDFDFLR